MFVTVIESDINSVRTIRAVQCRTPKIYQTPWGSTIFYLLLPTGISKYSIKATSKTLE